MNIFFKIILETPEWIPNIKTNVKAKVKYVKYTKTIIPIFKEKCQASGKSIGRAHYTRIFNSCLLWQVFSDKVWVKK